ncbi:MAG: ABC transporter permease [Verrucomicrobiales bacterium]|nr:ABC transporter permease [Verrucomicrobiales bacterium]MCP5558194.1 ABC transporter permease [Verrucomicrobiaceae bacterium]
MRKQRLSLFWIVLAAVCALYLLFWGLMLVATMAYTSPEAWWEALTSPQIRYATQLSIWTSTAAAALALLLAIPISYLLSRVDFRGRSLVDAALDIPIVLPPMVVGICLIIFFQSKIGRAIEQVIPLTYQVGGVVLAQFTVAAAFAIRSMRGTFDQLSPRPEDVALTLGCSRFGALWRVALPSARRGMVAAFCIAWARSLGEFGPILVFAGSTRMKTEVLPTTVWLEMSVGNLESAVAVSMLMIALAVSVLIVVRVSGERL